MAQISYVMIVQDIVAIYHPQITTTLTFLSSSASMIDRIYLCSRLYYVLCSII